jgi:hypothetical protein
MGEQPKAEDDPTTVMVTGGRRDRLMYMADLLRELEAMAKREGCATLSGLLALSHAEADRQAQLPV